MTIPHRKRIAELLAVFAGREELPNIGQFSKADERRIAWAIRHRLVWCKQAPWPDGMVGTCIKTWYVRVGF